MELSIPYPKIRYNVILLLEIARFDLPPKNWSSIILEEGSEKEVLNSQKKGEESRRAQAFQKKRKILIILPSYACDKAKLYPTYDGPFGLLPKVGKTRIRSPAETLRH